MTSPVIARAVLAAGPSALLVELGSLPEVLAVCDALRQHPAPGQRSVVPAARTVLVELTHAGAARAAAEHIEAIEVGPRRLSTPRRHRIDTDYSGDDLHALAALLGMSPEHLVRLHGAATWEVAFGGFAPGFAYLASADFPFRVRRRDTPRTSVPAGSVALADEFTGIYPTASPGGWQLIGRTDAVLWDLRRSEPALLAQGDLVTFVPVVRRIDLPAEAEPEVDPGLDATRLTPMPPRASLEIVDPGAFATVQDLGRAGFGSIGVPGSGAADRPSHRAANRIVGNPEGAATLELTDGGMRLRANGDQVVAVTGAPVDLTTTGRGAAPRTRQMAAPFALRDGDLLELGPANEGLRTYLAVRGGLDLPTVLGSRSMDSLSRLGGGPLRAGDVLPVGPAPRGSAAPEANPVRLPVRGRAVLRVRLGPRDSWFTPAALDVLAGQTWCVTAASNRVGLRLSGATPLLRPDGRELPSEGVVAGAIQVPASGQPVIFLADHPVTGGDPVIATLVPEDLPVAAQLPPGTEVRLEVVRPDGEDELPCAPC
jgi:KipI family sensor histidine kinase inhibitor